MLVQTQLCSRLALLGSTCIESVAPVALGAVVSL